MIVNYHLFNFTAIRVREIRIFCNILPDVVVNKVGRHPNCLNHRGTGFRDNLPVPFYRHISFLHHPLDVRQ